MLAGMALKWRWRDRRRGRRQPTDRPNMVMGANVQVCWEKFCRYWDVEPRLVPMEGERYHLTAEPGRRPATRTRSASWPCSARPSTGPTSRWPTSAPPRPLNRPHRPRRPGARGRRLGRVRRAVHRPRPGLGLPAAPGPVDQRLGPQVRPGVPGRGLGHLARPRRPARRPGLQGQLPGRRHADVRPQLLRPGNQVAAQYYNFVRLGFEGYRRVQQASRDVARYTPTRWPGWGRSS